MKPPTSWLVAGTMTRVPDGWCDKCQKSTLWVGPVSLITTAGVTLWGSVSGCSEEKRYEWKNSLGRIVKVTNDAETKKAE